MIGSSFCDSISSKKIPEIAFGRSLQGKASICRKESLDLVIVALAGYLTLLLDAGRKHEVGERWPGMLFVAPKERR